MMGMVMALQMPKMYLAFNSNITLDNRTFASKSCNEIVSYLRIA